MEVCPMENSFENLSSKYELIKQGAEARIYKGMYLNRPSIIKERFKKSYRHSDLDDYITKDRIKAEARSIVRCKAAGVRTPAMYLVDFYRRCIFMEEIVNSKTVKDYLEELAQNGDGNSTRKDIQFITEEIGKSVAKMHSSNIIHGDLTTSNILVVNCEDVNGRYLVFIDFGLSSADPVAEDKAVDLYVLEKALISTHANAEELFPAILESYSQCNTKRAADVVRKLEEVRARGRKRTMVG
ncbi:EKC/KEOPS complex subunit TP53RK isoform X1 [Anabrus simplex]|uniref:EKC/KEOPS complex subunit TP53RK isoform X1 n=1 Tax=Anabrus simplex TaxID=316456 RepID=UPI0035A33463